MGYITVSNGEILEEIKEMLASNTMELDEAMRLQLRLQAEMFKQNKNIDERLRRVEENQERYPSIQWMWAHQRGRLILYGLLALFVIAVVVNLSRPLGIWDAHLSAL